jgi:hypothetical protein
MLVGGSLARNVQVLQKRVTEMGDNLAVAVAPRLVCGHHGLGGMAWCRGRRGLRRARGGCCRHMTDVVMIILSIVLILILIGLMIILTIILSSLLLLFVL